MKTCDIQGCDSQVLARGLCRKHYKENERRKRGVAPRAISGPCAVRGCGDWSTARGLCDRHYQQQAYRSNPELWKSRIQASMSKRYAWPKYLAPTPAIALTEVSYSSAHKRTRLNRGKPTLYACVCGQQASEWAWMHNETESTRTDLVNGWEADYSLNPFDYMALCHDCHIKLDRYGYLLHSYEAA